LQSSAGKWRGITLEKHLADAEYVRTNFNVHSHLVHAFAGSPLIQDWRIDGRHYRVQNTAGSLMLAPKGIHASVHAIRSQPNIQWILELDPSLSEESFNGRKLEPVPQMNLRDPQAVRLVQLLQTEVESGCPTGGLFGEMLGNSLIVYLAERYSANPSVQSEVRGGLPWLQLKRVLEYVQAELDSDIHLNDLAEVAGLSPFHFAKLFKRSTGASPHQYILQRRLERAKELLQQTTIGLSEISLQTGFADQSHLTKVFRRLTGVTPSKFRELS
jgi:AraC family transcriptional regulator